MILVFKAIRAIPYWRLVMIVQIVLLARRHMQLLHPVERARLWELSRNATNLTADERRELRDLATKLEPAAFARGAARQASPFGRGKRR